MLLALPFRSVESEVQSKLESLLAMPGKLIREVVNLAEMKLGSASSAEFERLITTISSQQSTTPHHPSMRAYLGHPLRVVRYVLLLVPVPSFRVAAVALLHNIFEISGLDEAGVRAWGITKDITSDIRVLTIDRSRESDPAYLKDFYGGIETAGPSLALIRCIDKLDNLLGSQIIEDAAYRREYIELADRFVTSMATRLDPSFGAYVSSVCDFARQAPYLPELKAQLDIFIKRNEGIL